MKRSFVYMLDLNEVSLNNGLIIGVSANFIWGPTGEKIYVS